MAPDLPRLTDDGLITPEVGSWAEDKYRLVANYATMFSTAMRDKWDHRVYIDLFAGSGRSRIEDTNIILPGSPLLALEVTHPFDSYIFCEEDPDKIAALEMRVRRDYGDRASDCTFLEGDANQLVAKVLTAIPHANSSYKVLGFCFVDPYKLSSLDFRTVRELSARYMDFLVLIPSGMDARRNESRYTQARSTIVGRFLGSEAWRANWPAAKAQKEDFGDFITYAFGESMKGLRYTYDGLQSTKHMRSTVKNLSLYRLAFFSRHQRGMKFWNEALRYSTDQKRLFE